MTTDLRRRLLLLAAGLFTLWAVWQVRDADEPVSRSAPARRAGIKAPVAGMTAESGKLMSLPERGKVTEPVRDLFQLPQPPAPPPLPRAPAPVAPPLPFAYLGGISDAGGTQIFLSDGGSTLVAKPGSRLAGGWLLEAVEPGRLVFNYEALQQRQTLGHGRPPVKLSVFFRAMTLALLLAGCAGQEAFQRGEAQFGSRQWEAAYESYLKATLEDPANLEYRAALARAGQYRIQALLDQATATREQRPAEARELYRKVLVLDPRNEVAEAGLRIIEQQEKLSRLFAEALRAQQQGRDIEARQKLKRLLDEAPNHAEALALLRRLDEKSGRGNGLPVLDVAYQKTVTLEFRDAPLRAVFDALSRATGINIIFDRDLRQDSKVTVFLRQVPLNDALEQITAANGLARRVVNANTLLIYPAQPQKAREYQDLIVRSFFLANADGKQIGNMLKSVLKVKDFYLDEKRNVIVIRDTPEVIAMAVKLVGAHDQPEPEVMLEVEILEVDRNTLNNLGIQFPEQVVFGIAPIPITLEALRNINSGAINVTGLGNALTLNLKRELGEVNLLANPRIRVRNHDKANIHIGERLPVVTTVVSTTAAVTSENVSYLDIGIKLEVQPSIQMEHVVIKTGLEVSAVTKEIRTLQGTTVYQLGTRNASTTLTLRDGETQVLAGLLQRRERDTSSRLPGLGDIPVLGRLFSSQRTEAERTEILLSITPHILRNMERPSDDLAEFSAGPEAGRQGSAGVMPTAPFVPVMPTAPPAPGTRSGGSAPVAVPQAQGGVSSFVATPLPTMSPVTGGTGGNQPGSTPGQGPVPGVPAQAPPSMPPFVPSEFEPHPGMGPPPVSQ